MLKSTKSDCPDPQAFAQRLARLRNRSRDRSVASHHSSDLASHRRHRPELPGEVERKDVRRVQLGIYPISKPTIPNFGAMKIQNYQLCWCSPGGFSQPIQIKILPYLTSSFPTDIKLRLGPSCPTSLSYRIPSGYDIHSSPWKITRLFS